ncbi:hypothetical protein SLEP1_g56054 [Rubroshorea leprosula]|uniref:Uncharacterized protein n=1 Tax=Rubroshorea leprosula TaxID=152421 RepID=A0AAV5ML58_9ROSI|nr:hypothetical protein SLEP1_g56054 [Rubroshorea leprosula]
MQIDSPPSFHGAEGKFFFGLFQKLPSNPNNLNYPDLNYPELNSS